MVLILLLIDFLKIKILKFNLQLILILNLSNTEKDIKILSGISKNHFKSAILLDIIIPNQNK